MVKILIGASSYIDWHIQNYETNRIRAQEVAR